MPAASEFASGRHAPLFLQSFALFAAKWTLVKHLTLRVNLRSWNSACSQPLDTSAFQPWFNNAIHLSIHRIAGRMPRPAGLYAFFSESVSQIEKSDGLFAINGQHSMFTLTPHRLT
jgi:hypothetical protein